MKSDYIKLIFVKAKTDLNRYNINSSDKELINNLFNRLICSENLLRDIYILSHIKDLKNIGRYFAFILKKTEDNVINFDNLLQNLDTDTEFIENEILNFLSNPKLRENLTYSFKEIHESDSLESKSISNENTHDEAINDSETLEEEIVKETEEEEVTDFKKNYLELIQSEEEEEETVYELPKSGDHDNSAEEDTTMLFSNSDDNDNESESDEISEEEKTSPDINAGAEDLFETQINIDESSSENLSEELPEQVFEEEDIYIEEEEDIDIEEENIPEDQEDNEENNIALSDELQKELKLFEEQQKNSSEEENIFEEEIAKVIEEPPTNAAFIEYEGELKENNDYLNIQFEKMISALNGESETDETREEIIKNILERSIHTENISRNMSLEIISNIYQTINLSFEKISDGKYDLSESTLNLFKKGLSLILSLIKGDDYIGYKDILKSIENIRSSLLEEKEKRELYIRQLKEKEELKKRINEKFPEDSQKIKVASLKKLIKDTEINFNSLEKITGEYQIYEALRSLSGNLNNFKDIVILAKELGLKKLVQLAEASYIFVKFLQNYRINPVSIESKEIYGYIIYNLKSIVIGRQLEDIDIFISYLNDPVKIFSKTEKKKT